MDAMRGPETAPLRRTVEEQLQACVDLMESGEGPPTTEEVYTIMRRGAQVIRRLVHFGHVQHIGQCRTLSTGSLADCSCGLEAILRGESTRGTGT